MKNLILIPIIACMAIACNQQSKQSEAEIAAMKLTLDSITKVEQEKAAIKESQPQGPAAEAAPIGAPKKKISNTAKGAIIGAGVGAVTGAIIDKKQPVKGAVIGGVLGAGAGAVIGSKTPAKK